MGSPNSRRQILAAIEKELQADPSFASAFCAFKTVTRSEGMPPAEQRPTPDPQAGRRSLRRREQPDCLDPLIMYIMATLILMVAALTTVLAMCSPLS